MRLIAVLLIASVCGAQTPVAAPTSAPVAVPATASGGVTVAEGTAVSLTLVNSIRSKSTKLGDAVRAVVAFPVTVGTQVAIPAGTYVEGVVNAVTVRAPHTHMPSVQIQFTRLLFANGYSVALDAINTEAVAILPDMRSQATYEIADARAGARFLGDGFGAALQTTPEPAPLPRIGPNPAVVIGAVLGAGVGILALSLALSRHHRDADYVLFDNGWQFQMVLQHPLTLDAGRVAAAAGVPVAR